MLFSFSIRQNVCTRNILHVSEGSRAQVPGLINNKIRTSQAKNFMKSNSKKKYVSNEEI